MTIDTKDLSDTPVEAVAPVEVVAPVSPRQPDLKVLIMAGVLGNHPLGVSAHEAIAESGLVVGVADTILLAMEVVGAARRVVADDGIELWFRGEGDVAMVDPAKAPTHVTCPTCGHTRPVRRAVAGVRRLAQGGRLASAVNSDGSDRLSKNALRVRVEAFMRDLGPGHEITPGTVGRELGGRSPGAVGNAMNRLTEAGVLIMVCEAPVKYALASEIPAASAEVVAFMTAPVIAEGSSVAEVRVG